MADSLMPTPSGPAAPAVERPSRERRKLRQRAIAVDADVERRARAALIDRASVRAEPNPAVQCQTIARASAARAAPSATSRHGRGAGLPPRRPAILSRGRRASPDGRPGRPLRLCVTVVRRAAADHQNSIDHASRVPVLLATPSYAFRVHVLALVAP